MSNSGQMNKTVTAARSPTQRSQISQIAVNDFAAKTADPVDPAGGTYKTSDFITSVAQHAHDDGADEAVTAGEQNLHVSQPKPFAVVVEIHEVVEERRAAINRNDLPTHSVEQAAAQCHDAIGNLG